MRAWRRVRALVGEHGEHALFALALGTLVLLGLWWTRLLASTVDLEDGAARAVISLHLERAAHDPDLRDHRTAVVPRAEASPLAVGLAGDPDHMLDVPPELLAELDAHRARRQLMVTGEGSLLVGLLGVCVLMLYRLFTAQRAVQREMTFFVGQMTHEMKTPLAGLRALLETLQRGRVSDEDLPELLELGLQQIDREEHLVQTLLQAQRLRTARVETQPVAVSDLLARFVAHRALTPGGTPIAIDSDPTTVGRGDPDAVWTILENLVDNAAKQDARAIHLRAWVDGGLACVACEDDGRGFPPERAPELFRAFRSAHADHDARHGTGLGLYLSRRLARAMGGDLRGESPGEGRGARFVLTLPAEAT